MSLPASTIVHSHFSKWLDDRLDAALGDDAGATGVGGVAAFVRNISALPRRPVIGLRVAKRNASGLCAFVEFAVPALDRAKHIEAYASDVRRHGGKWLALPPPLPEGL